jgi:hypothetical protein
MPELLTGPEVAAKAVPVPATTRTATPDIARIFGFVSFTVLL